MGNVVVDNLNPLFPVWRMKKASITLVLGLAVGLMSSCGVTNKAEVFDAGAIRSARTAYVIQPEDAGRDVHNFIKEGFQSHGVATRTGNAGAKGNADLNVTYVDHWYWDIVMYLRTFDMSVLDARTGKVVATGSYANSALHGFPDPEKTVKGVVAEIFEKAGR
jgi:hypothetical protein